MIPETTTESNVRQVVPFLGVTDIEASVQFYVDGLGFAMTMQWVPEDRLRWCWLQYGGAALMLQEYWKDGRHAGAPEGLLGQGVRRSPDVAVRVERTKRSAAVRRAFRRASVLVNNLRFVQPAL